MQYPAGPAHLVDLLRARAGEHPDRRACTFLADGEVESAWRSYGELDQEARAVAALLQADAAAGERVLLLFPPGLGFVAGFLGCLYAGAVAVPAYPPRPGREQTRLRAILKDARPRFALTTAAIAARLGRLAAAGEAVLGGLRWLVTDDLPAGRAEEWREPEISAASLAFLQYTSGSTASPKGVEVSHGNLLHMEELIAGTFQQDERALVVGWLPLYHDMGLIGNLLQPLYSGASCVLMSPAAFLRRPRRWLEAISRYRATTSGGPDFAYDLCVRRVGEAERQGLDLASWRVAFNGAEPVRAETLDRFAAAFAGCGFRSEAFQPCYGLAEATLLVSGARTGDGRGPLRVRAGAEALEAGILEVESGGQRSRTLVGCGGVPEGQRVVVVDPVTRRPMAPGRVGEIWVAAGPSIPRGYWGRPEETRETFQARLEGEEGEFLRTGDLGLFHQGELLVTGRLKDLIILRGRNLYPQDVEATVARSAGLALGGGAAFALDLDGEERLVVAQEVEPRFLREEDAAAVEELAAAVRRAVAEEHDAQLYDLVLLRPGTLPKTSSGKVQRRACRRLYLEDALEVVGRNRLEADAALDVRANEGEEGELGWLRQRAAEILRVPVAAVGPDRPLVALGLDSLAAAELTRDLEERLGVRVEPSALLEGVSLTEILAEGASLPAGGSLHPDLPGEHPLSHGQRALWLADRQAPEAAAYNLATAARARSGLDAAALERALRRLAGRHAALRTTFETRDGQPVRRIHTRLDPDVQALEGAPDEAALAARLAAEAWRPFDLERGPLLRARVWPMADGGHALLFVIHHLVSDFRSVELVFQDLAALYREERGGHPAPPLPSSPGFGDHVRSEDALLAGPRGERLWDFWRRQLAGELPVLDLATDRPRPAVQTWHGASRPVRLDAGLEMPLRALAAGRGATLFTVLLAGFQALLHRHTGQPDLLVGSPTAGRSGPGLDRLVGYLVEPVVLRSGLSGDPTGAEWLERTRRAVLDALAHQDLPLALLAERLQPVRDPARPPLFQAMLVLQRAWRLEAAGMAGFVLGEAGARLDLGGVALESVALPERRVPYELILTFAETPEGLPAALQWNAGLWEAVTIQRLLGHLESLLRGMAADPERRLGDLEILSEAERRQLEAWSAGPVATRARPVPELFVEQAAAAPDAVAVVAGEHRLSYGELARRSAALARRLGTLGVGPEVPVGVFVRRTPEMVIALLAVWRAGGAYVPLDAAHPEERLALVLADSGAQVVLAEEGLAGRIRAPVVLSLDGPQDDGAPGQAAGGDVGGDTDGGHLAYVLYTSGSTGRPKGVAVEHRSVAALVAWARLAFSPPELAGVLAGASIAFDLSVLEIFTPLAAGGRLILAESALELPRLPGASEVTLACLVPSGISELARTGGLPASVRTVTSGGEALRAELARAFHASSQETAAGRRLWNFYGPTEGTVVWTGGLVEPEVDGDPSLGRPLDGKNVRVMDAGLRPAPAGVPGEICLGGPGVARGYRGRPDLTAERFVPDPLASEPGSRLYRSGDLGRWLPGGELAFLGRLDQQVKVRGVRVEPGEVEAALRACPGVAAAAVLPRDDLPGGRGLAAYVVPAGEGPGPDVAALRRELRRRLPEAMVPAAFVAVPALPLTAGGKVDVRSLPAPQAAESDPAEGRPRNPPEEMLAAIWAEELGIERVGVHDDFFALGGHSLLALRVQARVRERLGLVLSLADFFQAPTVAGLASLLAHAAPDGDLPLAPLPRPVRDGSPLPLSFGQERLWFLQRLHPGSSAYNISLPLDWRGLLVPSVLAAALSEMVARHESLRTIFAVDGGRPVQLVAPAGPVALPLVDLAALPPIGREEEMERLAGAEAVRPFDLAAGPLLRAALLRLEPLRHVLLLSVHHAVADGWSMGVLFRELGVAYGALARGEAPRLPVVPLRYVDFAVWQRQRLAGELLESRLAWWRERLAGAQAVLDLPLDRPRPAAPGLRGAAVPVRLPPELSRHLAVAGMAGGAGGATLFMALLAGLAALLSRLTGQEDLVIGSVAANRERPGTEGVIGLFADTLALRVDAGGDPGFGELAARVRETVLAAHAHQDLPFERLVEALQPERTLARSPLFQVMFAFQGEATPPVLPGLTAGLLETGRAGSAKFDLTLSLAEMAGSLRGSLEYDPDLFDRTTALRLAGQLEALLKGAAALPGTRLADLPLLTPAQRRQVVAEWNDTAAAPPEDVCLHELFERRAEMDPEAPAVLDGDTVWTYRGLLERSRSLAHRLLCLGIEPGEPVAIRLSRGAGMIWSPLAVLQAGGVYVPIDRSMPAVRSRSILASLGVRCLVADAAVPGELTEGLPALRHVVSPDAGCAPAVALPRRSAPGDLAYIIFTSGSTGTPKGVMVRHRPAVHLVDWVNRAFGVGPADRVLFVTSPGFDLSIYDVFGLLAAGGSIRVASEEELAEPARLAERLRAEPITLWDSAPAALQHLVPFLGQIPAAPEAPANNGGLRLVLLSGDWIPLAVPGEVRAAFPGARVIALGGATEATIWSNWFPVEEVDPRWPSIPYGRPIPNARYHVLDAGRTPCPIGVPGDLFIGGTCLASGYAGDPGLTADRFVPDPFHGPGDVLYRTGDRARWLADGNLQFLGRLDRQVKIRGFRVELGEIEAALVEHPEVREALVLVQQETATGQPPGERRLMACVASNRPLPSAELREHLRRRLPEAMMPAAFVVTGAFPVTPNGKVDRQALAAMAPDGGTETAFEAPRGWAEETLAAVWAELLGRGGPIGRQDAFFELGGHSLLAARLVTRVREVFGVELPLRAVFESPSLAGLAAEIGCATHRTAVPPIMPISRTARTEHRLPLSFSQERLWFLDRLEPGTSTYNLPLAAWMRGKLSPAAFAAALSAVVARHEPLRTTFAELDGRPVQRVGPPWPVWPALVDLAGLPPARTEEAAASLAAAETARPFDLERGPLLRTLLLRLGAERHLALLAAHHVVADGWSLDVLVREVGEIYAACLDGRAPRLPALAVHYADFAVWQRSWLEGEALEERLAWWRECLEGAPEELDLPLDRPRNARRAVRGASLPVRLPRELTDLLAALGASRGATLFMVLLAGFQAALCRWSGQDDLVVGAPVAGRDRVETEGLIGFFVNLLALRANLSGDPAFGELVRRARETALAAYAHQDLPFEKLVEELRPERHLGRSPLFQVLLALQNTPMGPLALPGLALEPADPGAIGAKGDLALNVAEGSEGLAGTWEYDRGLLDRVTAQRLLGHLETLLAGAAARPEARLSELPLLGEAERHQLVAEWGTAPAAGGHRLVPEAVAAQAELRPDAVALLWEDQVLTHCLTHDELHRRAQEVASRLRERGVGPGTLVGLRLERSIELVAGILGCWQAGAAWLPLDPSYPAERLAALIVDAGVEVVLGRHGVEGGAPEAADATAHRATEPGDLAYVLYTSGSTGRPKGVMVEHGQLAHTLAAARIEAGWHAGDTMACVAPFSFDIFLFELLAPLLAGGSCRLVPIAPTLDAEAMAGLLPHLTRFHAVPAAMRQVVEAARRSGIACPGLRTLYVGGDAVPLELLRQMREAFPAAELRVLYGPTEGTILAASWAVPPTEVPGRTRIGRPLSGVELRLCDPHGNPLPAGVAGEIWIGGDGVSRGYLDLDDLTLERFPVIDGRRFYRTGDLARFGATGELEFLGRTDLQAKVRGFRVEPGEVEAALLACLGVAHAAVVARHDPEGGKALAAWVVPEEGRTLAAAEVRASLAGRLPDFMVPAHVIVVEELPLTPHGKVDRGGLARRDLPREALGSSAIPLGPVEEMVAAIFAEVLETAGPGLARDAGFFDLGGHSLLATRAVSRIRHAFGVELPVRAIFEAPTVAALAQRVEEALRGDERVDAPPLVPLPRDGRELPLSFAQERLWFLDQLDPGSPAYNMPLVVEMRGDLHPTAFAAALSGVAARHEVLRTTFTASGGVPAQVVAPPQELEPPLVDLSALPADRGERATAELAATEAVRPFDLGRDPLLRVILLQLAGNRHVALVSLHHIVADGWSMGVFVRELAALYAAHTVGRAAALPELPVQYADFAVWQRRWLAGGALEAQLTWWRRALAGAPPLELPPDRPPARGGARTGRGASRILTIPPGLRGGVEELARRQGATPFMVLLAAFQALLGRWTGQTDVSVGTVVAGRNRAETEGLIGLFLNTLPLRADLTGGPSLALAVARAREAALGAYAHQDLPFEKLVAELGESGGALVRVLLVLQNLPQPFIDLAGLTLAPRFSDTGTAKFDLSLIVEEAGGGYTGWASYSTDLLDGTTIERLLGHLGAFLAAAVQEPERALADISVLAEAERHQLLAEWNDTALADPGEASFQERLAARAERVPDAVAVAFGDEHLTFAALAGRAARLASRLRRMGVGLEERVGICLRRSLDLPVAVLAVWWAGGAYVPVDPDHPERRRSLVLAAAGATVLLDGEVDDLAGEEPLPPLAVPPEALAYVVYTSGSTGVPKGVMVSHGALLGFAEGLRRTVYADGRGPLRMGGNAPLAFDASLQQIVQLLDGHTLDLVPEEVRRDGAALLEHARRRGLDVLDCTPSQLQLLLPAWNDQVYPWRVLVGGEAIDRELWTRLAASPVDFWNVYGPTEATVDATACRVVASPGSPVLGFPLPGARAYVLDGALRPVPAGVTGELFLGGAGLARGYLGRPELTAERFLPDHLGGEPGDRLYRTGDLARRLASGPLEIRGRADGQIKVRGMRIEPGEVEAALRACPGVREAAVVARPQGGLVGWVVPADGEAPTAAGLRSKLRARLPEAMVPAVFAFLEDLPLTTGGKVDRRVLAALAPPEEASPATGEEAPRTPVQEVLAALWCGLLEREWVGLEESFFDLGGHSLLAARAAARMREAFGVEIPLRDLFEAPTVAALAERIERERHSGRSIETPPIRPVPRGEATPLSFAQERLWLLDRLEPGNTAFVIAAAVAARGRFHLPAMERSLAELVRRHEVLRTAYEPVDGRLRIAAPAPIPLPLVDLAALPRETSRAERRRLEVEAAEQPFDLSAGPMLRVRLLRFSSEEHAFLFAVHHIAADGWSMGVIVRELGNLYAAFSQGLSSPLAELPVQYADYAAWQRGWLTGEALEDRLAGWREALAGNLPVLDLPLDRPRPAVQTFRGARRSVRLDGELADGLRTLARREGATLFMALAAAFGALLGRWSGQDDLLLGAPVAGRTVCEVEGIVGCFLNLLPLRFDLSGQPGFRQLLARTREVCLAAYSRQDLPFEKLLAELAPERDLSRTPLFQVLFNLLNLPRAELRLPGLKLAAEAAPEVPSKFDLTVYAAEEGEGISLQLVWNADLFDAARIEEALRQYELLLRQAVAAPDRGLAEMSLVTAESRLLLPDPAVPLPAVWPGAAHELFTRQAQRVPGALAATDARGSWSYGDLEAWSNRLARGLAAGGARRGDVVAVWAHRAAALPLALLAAGKAGAAFLVLDPAYPPTRLANMVRRARPRALIEMAAAGSPPPAVEEALAGCACRFLLPAAPPDGAAWAASPLASFPAGPIGTAAGPDDFTYLAFTSGSTGEPKAILGTHGPLSRFLVWQAETFGLGERDRFALLSGLAHDPLLRDVFAPLALGASLHVPEPEDLEEPGRLAAWLARAAVTTLHLTPALGRLLTLAATRPRLPELRRAFFGGDVLRRRDVDAFRQLAPGAACFNLYGATETPQGVGWSAVPDTHAADVPLGQGIEGAQLLVRNAAGELAGIGELGEICVRGPLALGYLEDPERTAERFPLLKPGDPASRVYRTGDLGRYLPDGAVAFAGRADDQVKVRGFRVETGEVEAALRLHPAVADAAVVLRLDDNGEGFLAAYLVPSASGPEPSELRTFLRRLLPEPMVPTAFVTLPALPLTPNRKLDTRALPMPERTAGDGRAPWNLTEVLLAGVWAGLLGCNAGPGDDFFALGGHSLLAARLLGQVRETLGVDLPLRAVFESPTLAGLAARVEAAREERGEHPAPLLEPHPRIVPPALSFAQERLWLIDLLEPGSAVYNMPLALALRGRLEPAVLAAALSAVVARHEALRTTFAVPGDNARPVQIIAPPGRVELPVIDLSALPAGRRDTAARDLAAAEAARPFDLSRGPVLRAVLLQLEEAGHHLLLTLHHIAADGWSLGLLVAEMGELYAAGLQGRAPRLPELPVQYADFSLWQRWWLAGEALEERLAWWKERLAGAPAALDLPVDRPRTAQSARARPREAQLEVPLPADLSVQARTLGRSHRSHGTTLFMTLLAAFWGLLARVTGEEDLVVGTAVAGRDHPRTESLIGFFANALPLRADLSGDPAFAGLAAQAREAVLGAWSHQDLPLSKLVDGLRPDRGRSQALHAPLFQVVLVLQNAVERGVESLELPGLTLQPLSTVRGGAARFDLTLSWLETPLGLTGLWQYDPALFDAPTVARLARCFETLLGAMIARPEAPLGSLPLLSGAERHQLLVEWEGADTAAPDLCLHDLLSAQTARRPDAVAVVCEGEAVTYGELDRRAHWLASLLQREGVGPDTLVGLCADRSLAMVVGIAAILRSGGAYVPLDPSYPAERLAFLLHDTRVSVLLAEEHLLARLPATDAAILLLDSGGGEGSDEIGEPRVDPHHLAYVIHTSGSTGRPKGAMVTHANAVRLLEATRHRLGLEERDVWTLFHSYAFDFSVWEIWGALAHGGRLVVVPWEVSRSPGAFRDLLLREGVTVLNQTPSAFRQLLPHLEETGTALRLVIFGGEALDPRALGSWLARDDGGRPLLVNMYGITETTVHVTWHDLTAADLGPGAGSPIGRPLPHLRVALFDCHGHPVPVGVAGEVHVGGDGLMRGYLGRPELTAERLVPSLLGGTGERLYRSGDLARRLPSGELEFLGRIDHQVKVRGVRIEPGEIEVALAACPGVAAAVVVPRDDLPGGPGLVACVVPRPGAAPTPLELRDALRERLPDALVPPHFTLMDRLPLTPSGKVDRRAAAREAAPEWVPRAAPVSPRTPVEEVLAGLFRQVLGMPGLGVHDDFFEAGGHSLTAVEALAAVRRTFDVDLELRVLFERPTVAGLGAALLERAEVRDKVERVAELTVQLAGLSEEEIEAMLLAEDAAAGLSIDEEPR